MLAGREHGILPVGLGARDTLRLEAGMPLYGHELNEQTNPYQAGLGFAVNLEDRNFLGSESLRNSSADEVAGGEGWFKARGTTLSAGRCTRN